LPKGGEEEEEERGRGGEEERRRGGEEGVGLRQAVTSGRCILMLLALVRETGGGISQETQAEIVQNMRERKP
jgi:hypothetical protein